ncbi:hypothetical protein [Cellulosimicrobium sp. Marseille-Q4280]|uniref:hypothetical protein n=1 Tax=Cellulosimicrobium sp. Marseille-Q4280 TaxID=2937992 RepID=UPI0020418C9C|nr:hypothetical protein [Cellulosimicrobium sp. Marseille-Q4280]
MSDQPANTKTTVTGEVIDVAAVPELERQVAVTIAFGAVGAGREDSGWWNHLGTAREVIRTVRRHDQQGAGSTS